MYCTKCGQMINEEYVFCPRCGNEIVKNNINGTDNLNIQQVSDTVIEPKKKNKKVMLIVMMLGVMAIICSFFLIYHFSHKNNKPSYISKAVYENGIEAIEIIDDVLDGKLDADIAVSKLDKLEERTKIIEKKDQEDERYKYPNGYVSIYVLIGSAHIDMMIYESDITIFNSYDDSNLLESRNALAKQLNVKER